MNTHTPSKEHNISNQPPVNPATGTNSDACNAAANEIAARFHIDQMVTLSNPKKVYRVKEIYAWRINPHYPEKADSFYCIELRDAVTGRKHIAKPEQVKAV
jgi:hypothetical protein